MKYVVLFIPLLPALAALVNGVLGARVLKRKTAYVACAAMLGTVVLSFLCLAYVRNGRVFNENYFTWIVAGDFRAEFGLLVDQLTAIMLLVVSIVGSVVFIYAIGYMHGDPGFARFFTYLPLFGAAMFLLVMANNFTLMFVGWEGVGLCSYLLIAYYYEQTWCAVAGKKAFIMTRAGDFCFLLGLFWLFAEMGSLSFSEVFSQASQVFTPAGWKITVITLLLFGGAVGKSAQFPLFVWLPDAMAGPTPVSALIHAATMVTAGVYLVARASALYALAPFTLAVIALVGAGTAAMAAIIGMTQRDFKKILAYSTISQLGYMFLGAGAAAFSAGIFHLFTHAFFKGCLFICAGSVSHAMAGQLDITALGGLRRKLPWTYWSFLAASLSICAIFPTAGFFSKDEILAAVWSKAGPYWILLWALGVATAAITSFYIFRVFFQVFHGHFRGTEEQWEKAHESPLVMVIPIALLALGGVVVGWFNLPADMGGSAPMDHFLSRVLVQPEHETGTAVGLLLALISLLSSLAGIGVAWWAYMLQPKVAENAVQKLGGAYTLSLNKFYWDSWFYRKVLVGAGKALGRFSNAFDTIVVDGIVDGTAHFMRGVSGLLRGLQRGNVQSYATGFLFGLAVLAVVWLLR